MKSEKVKSIHSVSVFKKLKLRMPLNSEYLSLLNKPRSESKRNCGYFGGSIFHTSSPPYIHNMLILFPTINFNVFVTM